MSKKLKELKDWAAKNVTLVDLLPPNDNLQVTTRLIDVLEDEVDEKYYLSEEKTRKLTLDQDLGGKLNMYDYNERDKVYSVNKVSPTLNTMQGGDRQPKIAVKGYKEIVKVRKYEVNKIALSELLRISKQDKNISNKEISKKLNVPVTKVEHWFRSDKSFSIPDANVWFELKKLLNITNIEHDEAITTFISKESNFDTTNRIYDTDHLSPTLNTTSEPKIVVLGNTSHTGYRAHDVHDANGLSPTVAARDYKGPKQIAVPVLTPDRVNKRQNGRRFKDDGEPMFTLTAQDRHGVVTEDNKGIRITKDGFHNYRKDEKKSSIQGTHVTYKEGRTHALTSNHVPMTIDNINDVDVNQGVVIDDTQGYDGIRTYNGISPTLRSSRSGLKTIDNLRIRKLTALECWRLQGFTDEQFYKAKDSGVSNSQLYKQSGNSVTVNVVDAIVKQLKE